MTKDEVAQLIHHWVYECDKRFDPVAVFPASGAIRYYEDAPRCGHTEQGALTWASEIAAGEEAYFVVVKITETQFKVIQVRGSESDSAVFPLAPDVTMNTFAGPRRG